MIRVYVGMFIIVTQSLPYTAYFSISHILSATQVLNFYYLLSS